MNTEISPLQKFLPIVRIAMLLTVLMAGGMIWMLRTTNSELAPFIEGEGNYMNLIFLGLICMVALVVMFVRSKLESSIEMQKKCAFVLMAWAFAEGIALLGAVYNIWGDATYFGAGLMILLMTFMVVPVPASKDRDDHI